MKIVQPGYFSVWVTCLIAGYEDKIVAGMVKKLYEVFVQSDNGHLTSGGGECVSALVSFCVYSAKEGVDVKHVYEDVGKVLAESKIYFYSVVVSAMTDASWCAGNMTVVKTRPNSYYQSSASAR